MYRLIKIDGLWFIHIKTAQGIVKVGLGYADKREAIEQMINLMYICA